MFGVAFFIFGLLLGSFLNVVIYRLPLILEDGWKREAKSILGQEIDEETPPFSLAYPPSHCPVCKTPIKPWSNIPIISFLIQKGKCVQCHTPISWQYPLVELLTAILFLLVYLRFGWNWSALFGVAFVGLIIPMIFIDAKHQILPDTLTFSLLWLGLIANTHHTFTMLSDAVWGAILGYMVLWVIYQLFKMITGKEGMGFGDFKLLAALGAWFGVMALPVIALLASVTGLVFAILMKIGKSQPMPFGPYLAIAGWVMLMFQRPIMQGVQWWISGG